MTDKKKSIMAKNFFVDIAYNASIAQKYCHTKSCLAINHTK